MADPAGERHHERARLAGLVDQGPQIGADAAGAVMLVEDRIVEPGGHEVLVERPVVLEIDGRVAALGAIERGWAM